MVYRLHRLSASDITYSISMSTACLISYWIMTSVLNGVAIRDNDFLGGMWAAVAAAFVFRDTGCASVVAGVGRLIATSISFALCLVYLCFFRPSPIGMAVLLMAGCLVVMLLDRRDEIITTGITTIVVMVVAILSPFEAWHQPLLRLFDTVVGISVGVTCNWVAVRVIDATTRRPASQHPS
jgi:uncharacterized membrane protein YgaE (UPF0421/DUF939 family)